MNSQGWRLGLLIARSVALAGSKPWEAEGISRSTWYRHNGPPRGEKISARKFSELSGLDRGGTVSKYLLTWNTASFDGLVPHSNVLSPGQEIKFNGTHTQELWEKYLSNFDDWYSRECKGFILDERHTFELWDYYFHRKSDPCVYFIGYKGRPELPVKIGKSKDVISRVSTFQTGNGMELEIILTIPGDSKEEKTLHKKFEDKLVGPWTQEWFNLTANDLEWVREKYGC